MIPAQTVRWREMWKKTESYTKLWPTLGARRMDEIEREKYIEVLEWEEDVLEDREMSIRTADEYDTALAEALHRRRQVVVTELKELK